MRQDIKKVGDAYGINCDKASLIKNALAGK
jgi:hypothetical protein